MSRSATAQHGRSERWGGWGALGAPHGVSRGSALLEFTALLPVFALMLMVTLELSRAWFALNIVTSAAREGARAGSVVASGSVAATATSRIDQVLGAAGTACANGTCTVICSPSPCQADSQVQVSVTIPFRTVVPLILPALSSINVVQTARMRWEGP
ncbi:MAG: pilus assembly protein [Candidatus Rokubacteria bacterium]|nr:pilus assembly protein [Candidatus Rokubacteria bacterium]